MRQAFKHKDPRGWAEFARMLSEHSAQGHAHTMLNLQLKGKAAVGRGGGEGVGKGVARGLAKEGVEVAICARRTEPLEAAAAAISKETGRKIVPIPTDLSKDADARNFVEQGHAALGRV